MARDVSSSPRRTRRPAEIGLVVVAVSVIAAGAVGAIRARAGSPADAVSQPVSGDTSLYASVPVTEGTVPAARATTQRRRTMSGSVSSAPEGWRDLTVDGAAATVDHRIEIDTTAVRQRWDGTGAALTDSAATLLAARPEAVTRLFAEPIDGGAGLDLVRLPLSSTDFSTDDWTWQRTEDGGVEPSSEAIAALDVLDAIEVVQPDVEVVAAAWTSPASFRTEPDERGGLLRDDSIDDAAAFLVDQVTELIDRGVDLRAVSLGNEPGHVGDYPTLGMTDDQMLALADRVAPSLDDADVDLLALDHNWSDVERAAFLVEHGPFDSAAFHCYEGDPAEMVLVPAAIVTECTATTGEWRTSVGWMARELVAESIRAGSTGLLTWNLALDPEHGPKAPGGCDDCRGLVTVDPSAGTVEPTPEFVVMRHLAAAADVDASVLVTPRLDQLPLAAFANPDGTVGLFGHNDSSETVVVEVEIDGATWWFEVEPWSVFSLRG